MAADKQKSSRRPFVERISPPFFILLCLVGSIFSGALAFALLTIVVAIFDAALDRRLSNYETAVVVLATLSAFIVTLIVLTKKRRAAKRLFQPTNASSVPQNEARNGNTIEQKGDHRPGIAPAHTEASGPSRAPKSSLHRDIDAATPPPLVSNVLTQRFPARPSAPKVNSVREFKVSSLQSRCLRQLYWRLRIYLTEAILPRASRSRRHDRHHKSSERPRHKDYRSESKQPGRVFNR